MTRRSVGYYENWAGILQAMLTQPCTLRELAAKSGVHYETLRPLVNALHDAGVVHISHWKVDTMGRESIASYQLGFGVDAPKRPAKTGAQRSMKYKVKQVAKQQEPLRPQTPILVPNAAIDVAMRAWGAPA